MGLLLKESKSFKRIVTVTVSVCLLMIPQLEEVLIKPLDGIQSFASLFFLYILRFITIFLCFCDVVETIKLE